MNQCELILQYMRDFGSITTMQAFTDLGITKLASRISELIKQGVWIHKEQVSSKNRYGKTVHYMRYSLVEL